MAQILLITAANLETGEAQQEKLLGEKPAHWCKKQLELDPEPIPLRKSIRESVELTPDPRDRGGTQSVFVAVDQDEDPLKKGLYWSDLSPAKVRELLREL